MCQASEIQLPYLHSNYGKQLLVTRMPLGCIIHIHSICGAYLVFSI